MSTTTLVFIHGAGCDHHAWDELRAIYSGPCVALDLPGRGETEAAAATTAAEAARSVLATISARGLRTEDAVVVGHSYGGAVAIECALTAPLAGLVLISTGARLRVHPTVIAAMRARAQEGPQSGGGLGWRKDTSAELVARFDAHATRVSPSTALVDWLAADAFDRMTEVARITARTLVIAGDEDPLTPPKYARFLASNIRGAELALLEGAGHMCIVEDAPRVATVLGSFAYRSR